MEWNPHKIRKARRIKSDQRIDFDLLRPENLQRQKVLRPGIYFLWLRNKLRYIGQSKNVFARVQTHSQMYGMKFDSWSFVDVEEDLILDAEEFLIAKFKPPLNVKGVDKALQMKLSLESNRI